METSGIGPLIVTAVVAMVPEPVIVRSDSELAARIGLYRPRTRATARNGEERGRGNTGTMFWKFEDLIARVSDCEELRAGEFSGSGTVGNGCGLEVGRFLEHGDAVELEVEHIGILRNRVLRSGHAA